MFCILLFNFVSYVFLLLCLLLYSLHGAVLLEKSTGLQLVEKFPAFHGTRMLITALRSVRHLSLSWASPTQSIYLLTPWCRVLLKKLIGLQLVKKFPAFHGTRMLITALTSVSHLSLSWASPTQSIYLLTPWCRVLLEKLNRFAASQEIPRISRNPNAHYRTHERQPPVSILGQPNPVHILTYSMVQSPS